MSHGQFSGRFTGGTATAPLAVTADPRSGTGLVAQPGQYATDGTTVYLCVGTGANNWVSVPYYSRTVTGVDATNVDITVPGENVKVLNWELYVIGLYNSKYVAVQPNASGANQTSLVYGMTSSSIAAAARISVLYVGGWRLASAGPSFFWSSGSLVTKTGYPRRFKSEAWEVDEGAISYVEGAFGIWNDSSTAITSLRFAANFPGAIGAGSVFTLWAPAEGYYV